MNANHLPSLAIWAVCALVLGCGGGVDEKSSTWAGEYTGPQGVSLTLAPDANGAIRGELSRRLNAAESRFAVELHAVGAGLEGTFDGGTGSFPLRVEYGAEPGQIVVTSEGAIYELTRKGPINPLLAGEPAAANPLAPAAPDAATAEAANSGGRNVVFNGQRLDDAKLASLEGPTPMIPDGDYWYDKKSGMAGNVGGPTEAYLAAGLDLGGPLSPNASGGRTRVAFNGRYLHAIDLAGLEYYFGEIEPGRYWIDGEGNYGLEGDEESGNLVEEIAAMEMMAQSMQIEMQQQFQAQLQAQLQQYQGQGGYYGQGGAYYDQGGGGGSVYSHFPNLGAGGTGVSVADVGGGDTIVNAGGVLWWPGK